MTTGPRHILASAALVACGPALAGWTAPNAAVRTVELSCGCRPLHADDKGTVR